MLKPLQRLPVVALATIAQPVISTCGEFGTVNEARVMLERAVREVRLDKSNAIRRFNHSDPQFRSRDLFVFCFNRIDGVITAHEAMVGRDIRTFRDPAGKPYGEETYRTAKEGEIDEVTFISPVPGSTEKASKRGGAYRPNLRARMTRSDIHPAPLSGTAGIAPTRCRLSTPPIAMVTERRSC